MRSKGPAAVAYRMAAACAVGGAVLIAVSPVTGSYQFLGLGLIALLTAGGWVVKARRARGARGADSMEV